MKNYLHAALVMIGVAMLAGCGGSEPTPPVPPVTEPVMTTLEQVFNAVKTSDPTMFDLAIGPGEPHQVLELAQGASPDPQGSFRSLSYWWVSTDNHIVDEESPTRLGFFDSKAAFFGMLTAAFRPQEDLAAHLLDACVRTANALMRDHGRNFDAGLFLGDASDNASGIEMEWFAQVLGQTNTPHQPRPGFVRPDTGMWALVNPADPSSANLGQRDLGSQEQYDPYNQNNPERVGYPNSNADVPVVGLKTPDGRPVPWYSVAGNHDALQAGNFPVDGDPIPLLSNFFYDNAMYVGDHSPFGYLLGLPTLMIDTVNDVEPRPPKWFYKMVGGIGGLLDSPATMKLVIDKLVQGGEPALEAEIDPDFSYDQLNLTSPAVVGVSAYPDASREFFGQSRFFDLLESDGHNFQPGYFALDSTTADGVGVPLRLIFLNTNELPIIDNGGMTRKQYRWIERELKRAAKDKRLVVILSHAQETAVERIESVCMGGDKCADALHELFWSHPNVILHLVGHGHYNKITPHPNPKTSGAGYWEVETSSTQEFPQQTRVIEVVTYENGVGELWSTMIDHYPYSESADANTLSEYARYISVHDDNHINVNSSSGYPALPGLVTDRNMVMRFQIPADVLTEIAKIAPSNEITSRDVYPNGEIQTD